MASGTEHLAPGLHEYLVGHSTTPDALLRDLISETAERFPDRAHLQIGPEQGTFMTMLAGLMGARRVVEVGTFTGYSAICLARGMAVDGRTTPSCTAASSIRNRTPTPSRSGSSTSMRSPTTGSSSPCSRSATA